MKKYILLICFLIGSLQGFSQIQVSKKINLGQYASGKWFKLAEINVGNSTYNSVVLDVDIHYVNTWIKYKIDGLIRMRKSTDGLFADWQYTTQGYAGELVRLIDRGDLVLELYVYSHGNWAHAATDIYAVAESQSGIAISLMDPTPGLDNLNGLQAVNTAREWYYPNGALMIGTDKVEYGYKLAVKGKIKAEEIKVTASEWADFVFADEYKLPPLEDVGRFVKKHKHLPGIPSEAEVLANGIELGAMDVKLLQKIEELTLYTLEQEKKIAVRDTLIEQLLKRVERLEEASN